MSSITVLVRTISRREFEKHKLPASARVIDLIEKMKSNPETVVVRRNGKIVPEGEQLADGDKIEIIPVVSGG